MAIEIRIAQKDKLYTLLYVQALTIKRGLTDFKELELLINQACAVMEAEDVSYVREQIAKISL